MKDRTKHWTAALVGMAILTPWKALAAEGLTLNEAINLAIERDSELAALAEERSGFSQKARAARALPDPTMKLGLSNLPVDRFDLDQEPMTQLQVGLSQVLPRGRSRALASEKLTLMADRKRQIADLRKREVKHQIRRTWLEYYHADEVVRILEENKSVLQDLRTIAESVYKTGRKTNQDVLQAAMEESVLEERLLKARQEREVLFADLQRWVGAPDKVDIASEFPTLPGIASYAEITERMNNHPVLEVMETAIDVAQKDVDLARQQYRPQWKLDLGYGKRRGVDMLGQDRPDLATAMVTFSLPLYAGAKQSREVEASKNHLRAEQYRRDERLIELRNRLDRAHTAWRYLSERSENYEDSLVPRAKENLDASFEAYRTDVSDFSTLMRAILMERHTRMDACRTRVDLALATAALLYLQGEEQ